MYDCAPYWHDNRSRWLKCLRVCADVADMYELERPHDREFERIPPWGLADLFWWNTTHQRGTSPTGMSKAVAHDPITGVEPEYDGPTAWACTIGVLMCTQRVNGTDIRFMLNVSGGRFMVGRQIWEQFSLDFRVMFLGLSGDMRKKGLRYLVLGEYRRPTDD